MTYFLRNGEPPLPASVLVNDIVRPALAEAAWARRGRPAEFFPTFETALATECSRLTYCCPACRQMESMDNIRDFAKAHHAQAPISMLIPKLSFDRCCLNPPLALLVALENLGADLIAGVSEREREAVQAPSPPPMNYERATMGDLTQ